MTEDRLEYIKQRMCDDFCKFPGEVPFEVLEDRCRNCPLNELEASDEEDINE